MLLNGGGLLGGEQGIPVSMNNISSGFILSIIVQRLLYQCWSGRFSTFYIYFIFCETILINFSEAAMFDMEYARWLEEHHRVVCEMRAALQEHLHENELQLYVENYLAHYNQLLSLKSMVAKTDAFHLVFGMWMTPAERCFMWIGGFRPSELIKVLTQTKSF